jgi:hypothetical protein
VVRFHQADNSAERKRLQTDEKEFAAEAVVLVDYKDFAVLVAVEVPHSQKPRADYNPVAVEVECTAAALAVMVSMPPERFVSENSTQRYGRHIPHTLQEQSQPI